MVLPILRSMTTRRVHNKLQQKNRSICSMVDCILIERSMEFRPSPPDSKASSARRWSVETGPRFTMANFNCFSSVELLVLRQRQSCRRSSSPIMLRAGVCSSTLRGTARVTTGGMGTLQLERRKDKDLAIGRLPNAWPRKTSEWPLIQKIHDWENRHFIVVNEGR